MSHFLVLDWDENELRYLSADVQKGALTVHKIGSAPILPPSDEADESSAGTLTGYNHKLPPLFATLRTLVKEERLDAPSTLIALDRSKADILYQTLPPCSEQEIPVLLKNQIIRELPHYAEHDPIDFVVLCSPDKEEQRILAAGIPLVFRQEIVRSFRSLGKSVCGIGFRPLAAADLFLRTEFVSQEQEPVLLVNIVKTDVEALVLLGKQVYSVRSFRLSEQLALAEMTEQIAEEIERTVAVGVESAETEPIKKVFLFGTEDEWTQLAETLTSKRLEVTVVNPLTVPGITVSKNAELPTDSGRFAALYGLLLSHQAVQKTSVQTIDFLRPKEPPKPRNYVPSILLAIVLLVVGGYGVYHWNAGVIQDLETELAAVKEEHQKTAAQLQAVNPSYQVLSQVRNWEMLNVPWLDDLGDLSQAFPGEQDLVITRMSFTTGRTGNNPRIAGTIQLAGMVRDPAVLLKLRNDLQAKGIYLVRYPAPAPNPAGGGYPWQFQTTIYRLK